MVHCSGMGLHNSFDQTFLKRRGDFLLIKIVRAKTPQHEKIFGNWSYVRLCVCVGIYVSSTNVSI